MVAAENTWGSIVAGLGGDRVRVTSIVADPNVDPHDYEATVDNAKAVSRAQLVVLNGGGYDAWMEQLLSSAGGNRRVVDAAKLQAAAAARNVHLFANPAAVEVTSKAITAALVAIDPAHASAYRQRYAAQHRAWTRWVGQLRAIAASSSGTKVAATESIALPVLATAGLEVVTPPGFMHAVAQGVDPPARDLEQARRSLEQGSAKLLASNQQATTPTTEQLLTAARASGVPVVNVFELLPRGSSYYEAMSAEARAIAAALERGRR